MNKELKKILFIDDDEDIHFILKLSLQDLSGVEVCSALSGEEGIKIAEKFHPDLILLDVMMPHMNGFATLQAMKLLPGLAHIPIVFLTAKAQKKEIEEYFKCGVADVIIKPFDPIQLPNQIIQIWKKLLN